MVQAPARVQGPARAVREGYRQRGGHVAGSGAKRASAERRSSAAAEDRLELATIVHDVQHGSVAWGCHQSQHASLTGEQAFHCGRVGPAVCQQREQGHLLHSRRVHQAHHRTGVRVRRERRQRSIGMERQRARHACVSEREGSADALTKLLVRVRSPLPNAHRASRRRNGTPRRGGLLLLTCSRHRDTYEDDDAGLKHPIGKLGSVKHPDTPTPT
jgi:hypothetical protein